MPRVPQLKHCSCLVTSNEGISPSASVSSSSYLFRAAYISKNETEETLWSLEASGVLGSTSTPFFSSCSTQPVGLMGLSFAQKNLSPPLIKIANGMVLGLASPVGVSLGSTTNSNLQSSSPFVSLSPSSIMLQMWRSLLPYYVSPTTVHSNACWHG